MIKAPRALRSALVVLGASTIALALTTGLTTGTGQAAVPTPLPGVAAVSPSAGERVGVGMPVTVTFAGPVADRAAAEQSIHFVSPKDVTGRFAWTSPTSVQFTPDTFWPAHSEIKMLAGGIPMSFGTNAAVVGVADLSAHTFTVSIDGVVARDMPASMGKPAHPTPIGSFTALEKQSPVVMDSRTIGIPLSDPEGYKLTVYDAVRVTWGGVYVHAAPWSVASQGNSNVSHGCINLSNDNAAWYYNTVSIGDPIIVQA
ncbi:L,D-transpeptidase [Mycolicibacterium komossense]|uniref:L,D-transpeptidase n=1 Tax=Mycolicibacterium komossense TaxID=1779 RepID=A0ABT3CI87_9MYCO|nr:L,D-transpeptidase [Mycolicibacterium komossense]MCV7229162.1 L,D-transpeptidase [Mycolicibacterium komossense]